MSLCALDQSFKGSQMQYIYNKHLLKKKTQRFVLLILITTSFATEYIIGPCNVFHVIIEQLYKQTLEIQSHMEHKKLYSFIHYARERLQGLR